VTADDRGDRYGGAVATGILRIHRKGCPGGRCRCSSFEAWVWDPVAGKKLRRTFRSEAAAKAWRHDQAIGVARGTIRAGSGETIRQAGERLITGMRAGTVRNRSGRPFKPSAIESYASALEQHVYKAMGARRVSAVERRHVQALADHLSATKAPSTVRNALMPLRVVFRRALREGEVTVNPVAGVELAAGEKKRDRFTSPDETRALLAAVSDRDRAAWALAWYAGLRLGEVRALRWEDVDLAAGELHVRQAWCNRTKQTTAPKTEASLRTVPIVGELRRILLEHRMLQGRVGAGLVVQRQGGGVESGDSLAWRAEKAWKAAGLERATMHAARHSYASLMILARVPITALSRFMGHTSITVTVDRYGHLYPSERQAAVGAFDALMDGGPADRLADTGREAAGGADGARSPKP
jgi:integrase